MYVRAFVSLVSPCRCVCVCIYVCVRMQDEMNVLIGACLCGDLEIVNYVLSFPNCDQQVHAHTYMNTVTLSLKACTHRQG